jgi:hypothetical protein
MNPDFHSRRFDPRMLFHPIGTDGSELFSSLNPTFFSAPWNETDKLAEAEFDKALEQVAAERCRACPVCGATVARGGFMLA